MENFGHSSNILSDCEFKYIPKMEFDQVYKKVQDDRRETNVGRWGKFFSISTMESDEENSVTRPNSEEACTIYEARSKFKAPLLGPARRYGERTRPKEANFSQRPAAFETSKASDIEDEQEDNSSVHIIEEVNAADARQTFDAKIQVPPQIAANDAVDESESSSDNDETLHSEILELCNEIENVNGSYSSSRNLNKRNSLNKQTEKERKSYEMRNEFMDVEYEFVQRHEGKMLKLSPQPQPTKEVRHSKIETKNDDDSTNSNNVYKPNMRNQLSNVGKEQQQSAEKSTVKTNKKVVSPAESRKCARLAASSDVTVNEKSQVADSARLTSMAGKVTNYQDKICQYLDSLREIISNPPQMEDINDLKRRRERSREFTNRFARNHLYQIGRMAEELRLMPDNPQDVATKVNLLFQAIMQAVQSYLKNIEFFIYNTHPEKLIALVDFIISASKICFDRKFFDKKNETTLKMLRRSVEVKRFLEMSKQNSIGSVTPIRDQNLLRSRHSYAYEKPKVNDIYSAYGAPIRRPPMKPKNPYVAPREKLPSRNHGRNAKTLPRGLKLPSQFPQNSQMKRLTPAVKSASPQVRKSISNISTMVQRESLKEKLEMEEPPKVEPDTPKELSDVMEILRNVAKEKIQELLGPYLENFIKIDQPRVTSDIKPQKQVIKESPQEPPTALPSISSKTASSNETVQRIAPNIQYLFVKSQRDSEETLKSDVKLPSSSEVADTKVVTSKPEQPLKTDDSAIDGIFERAESEMVERTKELALKERNKIIKSMSQNPLYSNEQFQKPWSLFADVSDSLVDDVLKNIIKDFDFGERKFVDNFLKHELAS